MSAPSIVVVRDLVKMFAAQGALLRAVDGVSFDVRQSETLGLVGESGSGKSTTGRILVGLEAATSGSIKLFGQEISTGGKAALGAVRRRLQFVFQDPQSSLNPRMRAQDAIAEPLDIVGGLSRGSAIASVNCWRWSACRVRAGTVFPTNFPVASVSASASRAPWR